MNSFIEFPFNQATAMLPISSDWASRNFSRFRSFYLTIYFGFGFGISSVDITVAMRYVPSLSLFAHLIRVVYLVNLIRERSI